MRRNRPEKFKGRHLEAEIIVLCVRWYLRFGLSFRNLEKILAERNLSVDHVTIWRWVQRYAPGACQGFRAFHSAWRTLQGIETMNMIRKGQVRWLAKDDIAGQAAFIGRLFGLTNA
jgi:transposase-like protein